MRFRSFKALLAVLLMAWPAVGQEQRGSITGILQDSTGGVLPGVTVEARGASLVGVATTTSDSSGVYRFPALPPGPYEITATLQGFSPAKAPGIEVSLGQVKKVDLVLKVGGLEIITTVNDAAPLIDVKASATSASIRDELIQKLPRGRDFTSVVTQASHASAEGKLAGISIDGASGAENRYIIDGIDTTNLQTGQSAKNVVTDFVDEVQVKSSGYAAEYGGATGGVINVITKSGGNKWTGDVGSYFSSASLNGDVRKTLQLSTANSRVAEYVTYPKDGFSRVEPGFTVGGPLATDRLWLFASYLPQLEVTKRDVTFTNKSVGSFRTSERTHYGNANLTAQLSSNLRGRVSANLSPYTRQGALPALNGTSNPTFDWPNLGQDRSNSSVSGNFDYTASNSVYFSLRGGMFRYNTTDAGVPNEYRFSMIDANQRLFPQIPNDLARPNGWNNIPTNDAITKDIQKRVSLSWDGTLFASLGGEHAFKGGVQYDRISNDVLRGYQKQRYIFVWDQPYHTLSGDEVQGTYGYYLARSIVTTGDIKSSNVGLFLQDTWTISNRLTMNLGIRTEQEKVPSFRTDLGQTANAIDFGFSEKLAPRVGFAWDVKGDGVWKAYGSWGVFYDITKLEMPRGSFGGDKWLDYAYTLDDYNWPAVASPNCPPTCPGKFLEVIDYRYPANVPGANTIDTALKPMRSQEFTFGLQHELAKEMSVGLRFVHKQLDRTIEDVGIIVPGIGEVYYIANPGFGVAERTLGPTYPAQPKATRDYDGFEVDFRKQFNKRWGLHASYLYSKLTGNYSGLASSDENGRSSPNVNRFFDALVMSFDQTGKPVFGQLATDRPHQLKMQAIYEAPFGTSLGLNLYWASGTPVSRQVNIQSSTPVLYLGRGSEGRTPTLKQIDLLVSHDFRFADGSALQLSMNVLNLFDSTTPITVFSTETTATIAACDPQQGDCTGKFSLVDFFNGFDARALIDKLVASGANRIDPRFLLPSEFQSARSLRFGLKYMF